MKTETKICNKCKKNVLICLYGLTSYKRIDGTSALKSTCNPCLTYMSKKWREKNIEKDLKRLKERNATPEHKKYMKEWRAKNAEKVKANARKRNKKYTENLTDMYVVNRLTAKSTLSAAEIRKHPELIEAHRQNIKLKRKINEQAN